MKIKAEDYNIQIMKNQEEGGYLAYISQLDCWGDGESAAEACKEVLEVANSILEMAEEDNIKIPVPKNKIIKEEKCSGKISLRMSKSLHAQLARRAEKEECSINQLINEYVSMGIGIERGKEKMAVDLEKEGYRKNHVQETLIRNNSGWFNDFSKRLDDKMIKGGM